METFLWYLFVWWWLWTWVETRGTIQSVYEELLTVISLCLWQRVIRFMPSLLLGFAINSVGVRPSDGPVWTLSAANPVIQLFVHSPTCSLVVFQIALLFSLPCLFWSVSSFSLARQTSCTLLSKARNWVYETRCRVKWNVMHSRSTVRQTVGNAEYNGEVVNRCIYLCPQFSQELPLVANLHEVRRNVAGYSTLEVCSLPENYFGCRKWPLYTIAKSLAALMSCWMLWEEKFVKFDR
jgi:hypothetical protein